MMSSMVLSEAEAESRLASLRRERDELDRAIADLSLYLELGRRLRTDAGTKTHLKDEISAKSNEQSTAAATRSALSPTIINDVTPPSLEADDLDTLRNDHHVPSVSKPTSSKNKVTPIEFDKSYPRVASNEDGPIENASSGAVSSTDASDAVLPEGVLARRYGRALMEAAFGVLEEAGRPLHAGEIFARLATRGFSLPGRDPVAALNTRLWKRANASGPLKRLGDAVYALAEVQE